MSGLIVLIVVACLSLNFGLFVSPSGIPSSYLYASDFFALLEKNESETNSVSFDFDQLIEFEAHAQSQKISGSVVFQKPQNLRIELRAPYRQITVSDGKNLYNYNSQTNQVVMTKWERLKQSGFLHGWPEKYAGNFSQLRKKYDMQIIETTTDYVKIGLKDKKNDFTMEFYFDSADCSVTKTEFVTRGTKITTFINNYKKNPAIDKKTFRFVPPKGAEIIK